jgi:hypothetical protein
MKRSGIFLTLVTVTALGLLLGLLQQARFFTTTNKALERLFFASSPAPHGVEQQTNQKANLSKQQMVFEWNTWLWNENTVQQSSISSVEPSTGRLEFESIVFFTDKNEANRTHFTKCLVLINNKRLLVLQVNELFAMDVTVVTLYKAVCSLDHNNNKNNDVDLFSIAVVDLRDYPQLANGTTYETTTTTNLFFHKPRFIARRRAKIRSTVNCVHYLRRVDSRLRDNMDTWIRLNKALGVGKISLCYVELVGEGEGDADFENVRKLQAEHGSFIEVVRLEASVHRVCARLGLLHLLLSNETNTTTSSSPVCNRTFFDSVWAMQEKICDDQWFML